MKNGWVDFREVRERVSMQMVLDHYQVDWLRKQGAELRGRCPIHQGEGERSFHVNLEKNIFYCFSCGAKGNVLSFVAAMENVSIREAGLQMKEWFRVGEGTAPPRQRQQRDPKPKEKPPPPEPQRKDAEVINPPLGFELKVDPGHEYGTSRGFSKELLDQFGAGYCVSKGMFSGRFVFPLHDAQGELVGYAGRSLDGSEPKYLFPSAEKGFHKRYLLWNFHREVQGDGPQRRGGRCRGLL